MNLIVIERNLKMLMIEFAKDKKIEELELKICFLLVQINKLYEVLPEDNKIPEIKMLLNYLNSSN